MINFLRGMVRSIEENVVTLEVQGVGFELMSPSAASLSINQEAEMHCYMHWSAENGPSFFGFTSLQERQVFLLILKCQGIGPKIAITILEQMSPGPFLQAILNGSLDALTALHGIGTKKAEQLIMQLRSPAEKLLSSGKISADHISGGLQWKELADALQSLNYSRQEISQVLAALRQQAPGDSFDQLLRKSLSLLSKQR
ncbi:Holliday junction branch migration protein RuvA [Candidatus Dependentiae bacterium]|nr:Holliday junction branch migration protein RuvA [Candidatus Dependentiae bacterium]